MNIARKIRREGKRLTKDMKVLQEASELESHLMLISHNVNQLRKSFSRLKKIEKNWMERREREKKPMDHTAGRNQGGFPKRP
jgi:hypothetical protein